MPLHAAIYCTENQQGQYRVQNGTVLQVCVDQSWESVDNTNRLVTDVVCPQLYTTSGVPTTTIGTETYNIDFGSNTYIFVIGALALVLLATFIGWMVTCVFVYRRSHKNSKPRQVI